MQVLTRVLASALGLLAAGFVVAASASTYFWVDKVAPSPVDQIQLGIIAGPDLLTVPRVYITEYADGVAGSTRVIDGTAETFGSSSAATFSFSLPVGGYEVWYYQLTQPDTSQLPDGRARIVVTPTGPIDVVEYVNTASGHYFMTADADEMRVLDDGTVAGWARTGERFRAIAAGATIRVRPVCRLYGVFGGTDTHFFTDDPEECDGVLRRWPDQWTMESASAFSLLNDPYSDCDNSGDAPLYRLFNNRPDVNHRYTTSPKVRDQMIAAGWLLEFQNPYQSSWSCALL